jgi:poly(3-hydroxybutyrate) depolymerase
LIALALGLSAQARAQAPAAPARERVTFRSGTLTLVGFLFKPEGTGPFPGLIWNHGSEKNPGAMRQFDRRGDLRPGRLRRLRADAPRPR